ncbi:MAG TPA: hypothetical protein VFE62_27540 [Gemmataceae bacterium]|nr:hypothetical protein [Gemmataceae bacterium]
MRIPTIIAAAVGVLAIAAPAFAQSYPAEAVILLPQVEVRSGPSKQFYATSLLKQNDKVLVLRESKEAPGWLEIMPPQGSFSWINAKDVKQIDATQAFVVCDPARPVSILPGSRLVDQQPNRESIKVTQGTIVVITNRPLKIGNDTWLPIQPHGNEVRYLPAEAVRASTVVATASAPASWIPSPNGYSTNSLLSQADSARKSGDYATAQRLYKQVADSTTDLNQKGYAQNALNSMSQQSPYQPASRTVLSPGTNVPPPQLTDPNLRMQSPPAWSSYGRLFDNVKMTADNGQPLYSLVDNSGKTIMYVTTNPGKSLADYVNRTVSVYGPVMYRSDVGRIQYIVASHVAVP